MMNCACCRYKMYKCNQTSLMMKNQRNLFVPQLFLGWFELGFVVCIEFVLFWLEISGEKGQKCFIYGSLTPLCLGEGVLS